MPVSDEVFAQRFKIALFAIIGICFLVCAIISVSYTMDFLRSSVVVQGRVVRLNFGGHHPQIEFATKKGEHISTPQSTFTSVDVGDQVPVRYMQDAPSRTARLDVFDSIWGRTVFFLFLGFASLTASLIDFISRKTSN